MQDRCSRLKIGEEDGKKKKKKRKNDDEGSFNN